MKLLHTSDWHLGRRLLSVDLLDDQRAFLGWLLELAARERVAAILVAGDVFDRAMPAPDCVAALDSFLAQAAELGITVVLIPGNHDSAVRLRYGSRLFAASGVHVRGGLDVLCQPVVLRDGDGEVGVYGVPYLHPEAVCEELGVGRSHGAVLGEACRRIRTDAADRGFRRTVVLAHAFVTGGASCESEREIAVGGVGDAPASVFAGFDYVALGHLHGPQVVPSPSPCCTTTINYSGSPLAFSFSERDHAKSVSLVELGPSGPPRVTRIQVPVPRALKQVTGELADLLARAVTDLADLADCYVKVVLTDSDRPRDPMAQLRARWPHTLILEFATPVQGETLDLRRPATGVDPATIVREFTEYVRGVPAEPELVAQIAELVAEQLLMEGVAG